MQAKDPTPKGKSLNGETTGENPSNDGGNGKRGDNYNNFLAELSEMKEMPQLTSDLVFTKQTRAEYTIHEEISKTLFSAIEEEQRSKNNITIKGLPRTINEYDFDCFTIGVKELLYVQSLLHHNEELNSGIERRESKLLSKDPNTTYYSGVLPVSLNDLCRHGYGVEPNDGNRKAIKKLFDQLKKTDVEVTFPNGDTFTGPIVAGWKYERKKDKATFFYLILNPIYTYQIKNQFLRVPYGVMEKISMAIGEGKSEGKKRKKTRTHIKLMQLLCNQDQSKPYPRLKDKDFLDDLGLTALWREQPVRTEEHIKRVIEDLRNAGIFHHRKYEETTIRGKKRFTKVTFYFADKETEETTSPVKLLEAASSAETTSSPEAVSSPATTSASPQ